jgi:hypothetical protein
MTIRALKIRAVPMLASVTLAMAACARPVAPPTQSPAPAEKVRVFRAETDGLIPSGYEVLDVVANTKMVERTSRLTDAIIEAAKRDAVELGADAIVVRRTTVGSGLDGRQANTNRSNVLRSASPNSIEALKGLKNQKEQDAYLAKLAERDYDPGYTEVVIIALKRQSPVE